MRPETKAAYPPDWPTIAYNLKLKRNHTCEGCGQKGNAERNPLTVHHLDYDPSNNDEANLLVLCAKCHLRLQQGHPPRLIRIRQGQALLKDCPDPLCILDIPDPTVCLDCPRKPKRSWGGKRAGAGAPVSNLNRLVHGGQSKLLKRGITRLAEDPELRGILLIITRLAVEGTLPPETRKLILRINPQSQRGQQVKRLIKRQKATKGVKR